MSSSHPATPPTQPATPSHTPPNRPRPHRFDHETSPELEPSVESTLGLTASDRDFLYWSGSVLLLLSGLHWALLSGWGAREVEISRLPERRFDFRVDINRATWVEWMQLENIGELTARKLVDHRVEHGPFRSIEDVDRVPGIGPKTLAAIRPHLTCSDCPPATEANTQ